jgi:hypothetical protein
MAIEALANDLTMSNESIETFSLSKRKMQAIVQSQHYPERQKGRWQQ